MEIKTYEANESRKDSQASPEQDIYGEQDAYGLGLATEDRQPVRERETLEKFLKELDPYEEIDL